VTINDLPVEILRLILAAHRENVRSSMATFTKRMSVSIAIREEWDFAAQEDINKAMLVCKL